MDMTKKERLKSMLAELNVSEGEFEKKTGLAKGAVSNFGENPRTTTLDKIKNVYPEINITWLLTGEGERLKGQPIDKTSKLSEVISALGLTKDDFAKKLGISTYEVNKMLSEELPIGVNTLRKLESTFGVNPEYITRGIGSVFIGKTIEDNPKQVDNSGMTFHTIKYYPSVNGSMGGVEFLDNPNETSVEIVIPGFSDCKFAVNAYGDSMHPVIKSGQIVVMMEWKESFIDWGRIYFVVTKNGYRAIKYLRPSENEGCIKCESENANENPAFDIEINEIHKLFLVKGWICREAI